MVVCLERGANDLHMVQLMPLPPHHLLLLQNPEWFINDTVTSKPGYLFVQRRGQGGSFKLLC